MPKTSSQNETQATRKATRTPRRAGKKKVYVEEKEEDEVRMPEGYNPSDDSEEEYVPPSKSKKFGQAKRTRHESDSESDCEEPKVPSKKPKEVKNLTHRDVSTKPTVVKKEAASTATPMLDDNVLICPKCPNKSKKEKIKIDGNARFHLSMHYYDSNSYSKMEILIPTDPDENGRAKDEKGTSIRYSCQYPRCTKRKMGYKEMCVHLGTQHDLLKQLMMEDGDPEVQKALQRIFPNAEKSAVKVKTEDLQDNPREPLEQDNNSENVDDPDVPADIAPKRSHKVVTRPIITSTVRPPPPRPIIETPMRPKVDKVMNCILCSAKDGRNLDAGKSELRYHMSVCAYGTGGFLRYIDPKQDATMFGQGQDKFEEFGKKYKYKCQFEGCDKASAKAKQIGYKELAIHAGVMHGILERWAADEQKLERTGAKELYETLKGVRENDGKELPDIPTTIMEEVHTCLICQGSDKDGLNLSLKKEKLYQTRYHYASCLYDSGVYFEMYSPGRQNSNPDGSPRDVLGKEMKYSCQEKNCNQKRKMGYKEFVIHEANDHGGLDQILLDHEDIRLREFASHLQRD